MTTVIDQLLLRIEGVIVVGERVGAGTGPVVKVPVLDRLDLVVVKLDGLGGPGRTPDYIFHVFCREKSSLVTKKRLYLRIVHYILSILWLSA